MSHPVLIVGAGPVGLVAALWLAEEGIPIEVLEAAAELPEDLRASTRRRLTCWTASASARPAPTRG